MSENIIALKKKIKICNMVTVGSLILIAVCMIAELIVSNVVADKEAARQIINNIGYFCYVLPFCAMIPLFFRVNFKSKLIMEMKKESE